MLSNVSVAHGIDTSENLSYTESEYIESSNCSIYRTETQSKKSAIITTPFLIVLVHETPDFFGTVKTVFFVGSEVDILVEKEFYSLVANKSGVEGYVFNFWLYEGDEDPEEKPEQDEDVKFNVTYDHVYKGSTNKNKDTGKPRAKLLYTGSGEVVYSVSNTNIISVDSKTGLITGKNPGTAYLIASVNGTEKDRIPVYCIYQWKKSWTGKANKSTNIYTGTSASTPSFGTLSSGSSFYVCGDDGGSSGWAYGKGTVDGKDKWGFVKINDISTKGTTSQYNLMNFRWPVYNINIKKISSPFGPRSSDNGGNHKGFDVVSDNTGEIEGESVVASCGGTIKKIYIDNNKTTSHGNAIVITTDKTDPVSGKKLTAIYMHLSRWNTNLSGNIVVNGKVLKEGDSIAKEQLIGCAGNTGYNTSGAHLHYEVNNQNAAIRSGSNNPFTETINPIFFYMDMDNSITKSNTCEAASNGNGFYWYGENE